MLHWLMVHLSQESGSSNSASRAYNFWSGFGGDIAELALLGGVIQIFRHRNCHVKGCWRFGKQVDGTPYLACPKHHPDHKGDKRNVSLDTIRFGNRHK
jgi:hypothetical protein